MYVRVRPRRSATLASAAGTPSARTSASNPSWTATLSVLGAAYAAGDARAPIAMAPTATAATAPRRLLEERGICDACSRTCQLLGDWGEPAVSPGSTRILGRGRPERSCSPPSSGRAVPRCVQPTPCGVAAAQGDPDAAPVQGPGDDEAPP